MKSTARNSIWTVALGAAMVVGVWSSAAYACTNDIDCPEPACGGQVCDWTKGMTCQPAGGAPMGVDGWCTVDADCKCLGEGATCSYPYCTFTVPQGGSGGAGGAAGAGTGGSAGTGSGGAVGTGGDSGTGSGGAAATGSGGSSAAGSGGPSATGSGGSNAGAASDSGGGCSVAGAGSSGLAGVGLLLGLAALVRRRGSRR